MDSSFSQKNVFRQKPVNYGMLNKGGEVELAEWESLWSTLLLLLPSYISMKSLKLSYARSGPSKLGNIISAANSINCFRVRVKQRTFFPLVSATASYPDLT